MRTGFVLSSLATIFLLSLASCSTLPADSADKGSIAQRKQAVDYATQGDAALGARNWPQAENFYQLSLDSNRAVDNLEGAAQADFSLGFLYLLMEKLDDAQRAYQDGSELAELTGNPLLIATGLLNEAKVFNALSKPLQAVPLLIKAEQTVSSARNNSDLAAQALLAAILHAHGIALRDLGKLPEARAEFEAALKINTDQKKLRERAGNLYMLASLDNTEGKNSDAIAKLLLALDLDKQAEASENIAKDLWALSVLYRKVNGDDGKPRLLDAWNVMRRSLYVALAISDASATERCLAALPDLAKQLGKTDEAKKYASMYTQLLANKAKQ